MYNVAGQGTQITVFTFEENSLNILLAANLLLKIQFEMSL
jgi:hypothetical protein